ncbi:sigma factor [Rhodococcus sp. NPDC058505]|uniref:sigma factor n=1 Tax=Rhodococcus sp. NPDC058505 TaxID=3346531 RepID=UPI00365FA186
MPQDDAERVGALYGDHAAPLWGYAMRLTGDRVRAEEVTGEALLRAARSPVVAGRDPQFVREWLFAVARRVAQVPDTERGEPAAEVPLRADAVGDPPPDLLPTLLGRVGPPPHRIRTAATAVGVVAVATAVVAVVALLPKPEPTGPSPTMPQGPSAPVTGQPMQPVAASPVSADVSVIQQDWGSRIDAVVRYPAPPGGGFGTDPSGYEMVLTDHTGARTTLATWTAVAGETVTPSTSTELPMLWITRVDIRAVPADRVLLTSTF